MAIKDWEDKKITPKDAAKKIIATSLEYSDYWIERSNGFSKDNLTQREINLINEQLDKLRARIERMLK